MDPEIQIIECPRDAMQGLERMIPTDAKVRYISQLLMVGFHTIDFGSFVSPRAIPQMADTARVLEGLDVSAGDARLLAIVANRRGAEEASRHDAITYLGYPLSISETFQKRNTNSSITDAINTLGEIKDICDNSGKKLVTYVSMGFGNPYGDPYEVDLVNQFVGVMVALGADVISLADTIGVADSQSVEKLFRSVSAQFPEVTVGVHLHSTALEAPAKNSGRLPRRVPEIRRRLARIRRMSDGKG